MARQNLEGNSIALAGSAFVLGLITGMAVKGTVRQAIDRARDRRWHREHERTVTFDENLPGSLGRREPAPESKQPRFGGTGALGVHPAVAQPQAEEPRRP